MKKTILTLIILLVLILLLFVIFYPKSFFIPKTRIVYNHTVNLSRFVDKDPENFDLDDGIPQQLKKDMLHSVKAIRYNAGHMSVHYVNLGHQINDEFNVKPTPQLKQLLTTLEKQ